MKKSYFGLKIGMAFSSPVSASEPSIMIGKILKYTLKVVSVLVAIVLLILLLLYMPFVQDFVKSEGFDYIQRKTQMHLSAERIRLSAETGRRSGICRPARRRHAASLRAAGRACRAMAATA